MGIIPNLSRVDSKDLRVSSMPSLSSFVVFSEKFESAFSKLSIIGRSSKSNLSVPYLCAFSTSARVLFNALSKSAFDLNNSFSSSSFLSNNSS